jgi:hypothetical protein
MELTNFNNMLTQYEKDIERVLKNNLVQNNRVASGNLLKSISVSDTRNDAEITVNLNSADYLKQVSEGRKPSGGGGNGSLQEKIKTWIEQKNILPRENKITKDQLAFLIARKIHNEGYEGSNDYAMTVEEVNGKYLSKLQEALEKDLQIEAEMLINTSVGQIIF